jgi:hypothetical protein
MRTKEGRDTMIAELIGDADTFEKLAYSATIWMRTARQSG